MRLMLAIALLCVTCCASPQHGQISASQARLTRLLVGRWYQLDAVGQMIYGPNRFELSFAADGTCAYSSISKISEGEVSVARGRWRAEGQSIAFQWEPDKTVKFHLVDDGLLSKLDRKELWIQVSDEFHGFQTFYRNYRQSVFHIPNA